MAEELKEGDSIIGRHILVGLTYLDEDENIKERVQLHGSISSISNNTITLDRADGKGIFSIPFDGELETADPETTYTLESTGEVVKKVDLIVSWTIRPPTDDEV